MIKFRAFSLGISSPFLAMPEGVASRGFRVGAQKSPPEGTGGLGEGSSARRRPLLQIERVNARLLLHEHLAAVATLTQDVDTLVQFALRHAFTAEVVDGSAFKVGVVGGQCADSRVHVLLAHAD